MIMEHRSKLYLPLTKEQLDAIVKTVFGVEKYTAHLIEGGLFNTTYELNVLFTRHILRVGPINRHLLVPYEHHLMAAENFAYTQMKHAGIPCSDVICCDTTKQLIDRDFMIVSAAEGEMLSKLDLTEQEKEQAYEKVGLMISKLHQIKEPMFGRLADVLQGKGTYTWFEALWSAYIDWKSVAIKTPYFTAAEYEAVEYELKRDKQILNAVKEPYLTHCDLWENNVLAKRDGKDIVITALIDIDRAFCGDPEFEFGYEFMLTDAFKKGYGCLDDAADAIRRRLIYRMLCCFNDAYVWYVEYENIEAGDANKKAAMEALAALTDI